MAIHCIHVLPRACSDQQTRWSVQSGSAYLTWWLSAIVSRNRRISRRSSSFSSSRAFPSWPARRSCSSALASPSLSRQEGGISSTARDMACLVRLVSSYALYTANRRHFLAPVLRDLPGNGSIAAGK